MEAPCPFGHTSETESPCSESNKRTHINGLLMTLIRYAFLVFLVSSAFGQRPNFSVHGLVVDSLSGEPLEYATVMLHNAADSSLLTGMATTAGGGFVLDSLRPGRFYARVSFLGYEVKTLPPFNLNRETTRVDLGRIPLAPSGLIADEVTVTGERMTVEYHVEKKVINVAKQQIVPTGTATDVLANSPGVSVDIEGNVKLRGSGNFTVMIDGRPSILDANDALQQIPAATIDRIEIITNPSARFSAEGTAGIINIIPLKRGTQHTAGQINLRSGVNEQRSLDFSLQQPVGRTSLTVGGDLGKDNSPGESRSETRTTFGDATTTLKSDGSSIRHWDRGGLRAELDVPLSSRNNLSLGGRFGTYEFGRDADLKHRQTDDLSETLLLTTSDNRSNREHRYVSGFANWKHRFPQDKHVLTMDLSISRRSGEEVSTNESFAQDGSIVHGLRTFEDGPGGRSELKLDYVRPLGNSRRFEAGTSVQSSGFRDNYAQSRFDTISAQYVDQSQQRNSTRFRRNLPAFYTMYADEGGPIEYQFGLRGEYLDRTIERVQTSEEFSISRFDLYPTAHSAYNFGGGKQAILSYTRRVQHSRPWDLEPFLSWEDAYSVRSGNPGLKPEFIDSYELGYQTSVLKQFVSVEGFYRVKHNNVERLRSVYAENVTLERPENVGRQFSLGTELRTDIQVQKGWNLTLSGSFYDQRVKGEANGISFDENDFSYDGKLSSITTILRSTRIQLDGQYRGPSVTSQGTAEASVTFNGAIRQDFLDRRLNVALQVRDIFATGKRESTSESPGLYSYNYSSTDAPVFTLSVGYSFNNFKKKQNGRGDETGEDF